LSNIKPQAPKRCLDFTDLLLVARDGEMTMPRLVSGRYERLFVDGFRIPTRWWKCFCCFLVGSR
jgi:hypothetical protein